MVAGKHHPFVTWVVRLTVLTVVVGGAAYLLQGIWHRQPAPADTVQPRRVAVSSHLLDFGTVPLRTPAVRTFALRNDGEESVVVMMSVGGPPFHIKTPKRVTLQPGTRSLVNVQVKADRPGALEDQLRVLLNGETEPLVVTLKARAQDGLARRGSPEASRRAAMPGEGPSAAEAGEEPQPGDMARLAAGEGTLLGQVTTLGPTGGSFSAGPGGRDGAQDSTASGVRGSRPAAPSSENAAPGGRALTTAPPGAAAAVFPYDPTRSAPVVDLTQRPATVRDTVSREDQDRARSLPEQVPKANREDVEDLFDPAEEGTPPKTPKPSERRNPTLRISGVSKVTLLGTSIAFYPQQIGVVGTDRGGPVQLSWPIQFPVVPLAFGESMAISQSGPSSGAFNVSTGELVLRVPLIVVDSDGDGAAMNVQLTTGTTFGRNDAGLVVSMTGSPRVPESKVLKLVGLEKIPTGYGNGAEDHLVAFEILALLDFGTPAVAPL